MVGAEGSRLFWVDILVEGEKGLLVISGLERWLGLVRGYILDDIAGGGLDGETARE